MSVDSSARKGLVEKDKTTTLSNLVVVTAVAGLLASSISRITSLSNIFDIKVENVSNHSNNERCHLDYLDHAVVQSKIFSISFLYNISEVTSVQ